MCSVPKRKSKMLSCNLCSARFDQMIDLILHSENCAGDKCKGESAENSHSIHEGYEELSVNDDFNIENHITKPVVAPRKKSVLRNYFSPAESTVVPESKIPTLLNAKKLYKNLLSRKRLGRDMRSAEDEFLVSEFHLEGFSDILYGKKAYLYAVALTFVELSNESPQSMDLLFNEIPEEIEKLFELKCPEGKPMERVKYFLAMQKAMKNELIAEKKECEMIIQRFNTAINEKISKAEQENLIQLLLNHREPEHPMFVKDNNELNNSLNEIYLSYRKKYLEVFVDDGGFGEEYQEKLNIILAKTYDALMKRGNHKLSGSWIHFKWYTSRSWQFTPLIVLFSRVFSQGLDYMSPDGNIHRYLKGQKLKPSDVDVCLNTLTLVNALLLTIPFGIVISFNSGFWNNLRDDMHDANCGPDFYFYYYNIRNDIMFNVYASITAIIVSVTFYILKPDFEEGDDNKVYLAKLVKLTEESYKLIKLQERQGYDGNNSDISAEVSKWYKALEKDIELEDKKNKLIFILWWNRARWVVFAIAVLTVIAVLSLIGAVYLIFSVVSVPSPDVCEFNATTNSWTAICIALFVIGFSVKKLI